MAAAAVRLAHGRFSCAGGARTGDAERPAGGGSRTDLTYGEPWAEESAAARASGKATRLVVQTIGAADVPVAMAAGIPGVVADRGASDRLAAARRLLDDYERRQPARRRARRLVTGWPALDAALGGGLPRAALCAVRSEAAGLGALSLGLRLARAAARERGLIFLIDPQGYFFPPAAVQLGLALDRLIIVRRLRTAPAVWAMEQALRCSAVAAAVGLLDGLDAKAARRLQLAAEAGGGVGLLVVGDGRTAVDQFAAVRIVVEREGKGARRKAQGAGQGAREGAGRKARGRKKAQ